MRELVKAHLDHRRLWRDFDYCYPVVSRRSHGVSLGVNLNPDKVCNFDCVYCEVDRTTPGRRRDVDLDQLATEMALLLDLVVSGDLFRHPPFDSALEAHRRLNDIAFSGDGEPTTCPVFREAVLRMAELKDARGLHDVKLVLITDATRLQAPDVVAGLEALMAHQGEVWAKLDAGTGTFYREINRSRVPFARVLENLEATAARWPITIQSLFLSWNGQGPTDAEVEAYLGRLARIRAAGTVQAVQAYTVARPTPEPGARPLPRARLEAVADRIRAAFPDLPVETYPGPEVPESDG